MRFEMKSDVFGFDRDNASEKKKKNERLLLRLCLWKWGKSGRWGGGKGLKEKVIRLTLVAARPSWKLFYVVLNQVEEKSILGK